MRPYILLLALMLAGCGRLGLYKPADPSPAPSQGALQDEYDRRFAAFDQVVRPRGGWPSVTDCDGTVWAATACLAGVDVDLVQAEYPPGHLNRRPAPACWQPGDTADQNHGSASENSRDQAVLYAACKYKQGDRGALERLLAYAGDHLGFMGEPHDLGLTFMGPNLAAVLSHAVAKLGGSGLPLPAVEAPGVKDYQQHVEAELILWAGDVAGGAMSWELADLDILVAAHPDDALFQAARGVYTGDFAEAARLLLDPLASVPTYVRGAEPALFAEALWLRTARLVLDHLPKGE